MENQSYQHKSDVLQGTILLTLMKINAQHLNQDIAFCQSSSTVVILMFQEKANLEKLR